MPLNPQAAYVGHSAFAHKAGLHMSAIAKRPDAYEHLSPDVVGNGTRFVVSELAGKSTLGAEGEGARPRARRPAARRGGRAAEAARARGLPCSGTAIPARSPGMARPIARRDGAAPPALPQSIRPQLTQLVDTAPDGDQWLHEIKYDDYRMHTRLDRGAVKLADAHRARLDPQISRNRQGRGGARRAPGLSRRRIVRRGPERPRVLNIVQLASDSGNAAALVFFLFDLLYLDGEDLRPRPLIDRKEPGPARARSKSDVKAHIWSSSLEKVPMWWTLPCS